MLLVVVLLVLVLLVLVLLVLVVLLVVLLRVGSAVRGGAIAATRCSDVRWTRPARGNIDRSIANRCHNLAVDSTSPVALL